MSGREYPANMPKGKGCDHCGTYTETQCGSCKSIAVCSKKCLKALWKSGHKAECKNICDARAAVEASGYEPAFKRSSAGTIDAEDFLAINTKSRAVYEKYGIVSPPMKGSTMRRKEKLEFFLDMLKANDSSSDENKTLPLNHHLLLNRRYNNTYRHAMDNLSQNELHELDRLMERDRVGEYFKGQA